jgi:competence protein ComGC
MKRLKTIYHLLPTTHKHAFTLVEMLIIAPIVILVIGIFISAIVSMTGEVLSVRGANALTYNVQNALDTIDADVKSSSGYLATNNVTLTSGQGFDNGTSVFKNATAADGNMLILNSYATTANPLFSARSYIYTPNQPNTCTSTLISQNSKVMTNIVYFVKSNALWRRVLMQPNYETAGCSLPWQKPTCVPGYNPSTYPFCKADDIKLVDGISTSGFVVNYFTAGSTTPNTIANASAQTDPARQAAMQTTNTVGVTINAAKTYAGRDIAQSGKIKSVSANNNIAGNVVTSGMILNLDATNNLSYPGFGTTWTDLSGLGNNGTLGNGPTYSSSNGGSLSFNYDTPNYITVPLANSLNKTEGTINFWIYPTRYSGANGYFVNREDSTPNAVDWLWIGPYSDTFYFRIGNGSDCCSNDLSFGSVSTVIPINTWTNMSFTWKINGTSVIYKNGILLTSRGIGSIPNTNPAANGRIGLGHANGPSYFDGKMAVVQNYNRALSASEVLQNFNALRGRYGL